MTRCDHTCCRGKRHSERGGEGGEGAHRLSADRVLTLRAKPLRVLSLRVSPALRGILHPTLATAWIVLFAALVLAA